ncbi:hypothetical protein [Halopseudomonas maritima]|uniref:hypothetical protein n=1 Tax=Halopseudomonas maritima TaxID=2918528 RepID=UPI001EE9C766|nr:hypothetical protein [Halopseudomonas maritima]UJJ32869.1 hypothetical protein HV822_06890 [Halopseudomonas maritima]
MLKLYRGMLIAMLVLHGLWVFVPWFSWLFPDAIDAIYWSGYGARMGYGVMVISMLISVGLYFLAYIGMIFLFRPARTLHVLLVLATPVLSLAYGVGVFSPVEVMFLNLLGLCDGFVVALGFFTSVNERFISNPSR